MLTELCEELKNWFVQDVYRGSFGISNGRINLPCGTLQNGQFFRIVGSVFNDGVWQFPNDVLIDETFNGAVWAMAAPPSVIALAAKIDAWREQYEQATESPYQSESFGNYSYTLKSGSSADGASGNGASWQSAFRHELNKWRKI